MANPNSAPLVSVCIPVYNCAPFIGAAIQSVLEQTLTDFELVIIDNASTDGTLEVVARYSDPRIRVLKNETNIGAEGNWNRCLEEAKGKYVKILPADDLLYPESLAKQTAVLEDPANHDVSVLCSKRDIISDAGKPIYKGRGLSQRGKVSAQEAMRLIARSGANPLGEPHAVLFRSKDIATVGKFDGSIGYVIDLDFWCRLLAVGQLYCLPESLSAFRVSTGSWSASIAKSQAIQTRRFWKRLEQKGLVSSLDILIGSVMASVLGVVRQLVYVWLRS